MSRPGRSVRYPLQPHESSRVLARQAGVVLCVDVAALADAGLRLRYSLLADPSKLRIPAPSPAPARVDGLWRHTCFEAFIGRDPGDYGEYNFSPSGDWAAYRFSGYREGMTPLASGAAPVVTPPTGGEGITLQTDLDLAWLLGVPNARLRLGLATILEHASGELSYWALNHPAGKPDFHHADGFMIELG